ncbi:hypothetical protein HFA01_11990 [Halobacillus faecis]|uniref:Uncharacterized protein n=1 Tax=Halobacillus faecis TaxID=360184 RepID=A0A511WPH6_9BACI|nr:hypothetical protein HFA01_11990 [Halobacillus faecis]
MIIIINYNDNHSHCLCQHFSLIFLSISEKLLMFAAEVLCIGWGGWLDLNDKHVKYTDKTQK